MAKIQSKDGFVFALKDRTAVYDNVIYLSDIDSRERYIEISVDEAKALKEEIDKRALEELNVYDQQ